MRYGVIYSFDIGRDDSVRMYWPSQRKLFAMTEGDDQADYEDVFESSGGSKHRKLVSRDLLTQEQFDRFVSDTGLHAESTETMGSLTGGMWGLGWHVPAIAFNADSYDAIVNAYVTPVPEVERNIAPDDPTEADIEVLVAREERVWERIKHAIVKRYT